MLISVSFKHLPSPSCNTVLANATDTSLKHARHPQLLLGLRTHPPPPLPSRARVPGNQTAHPSPQRALSRFFGLGRDSVGQYCGREDDAHHVDYYRVDCVEYFGDVHRGFFEVWHFGCWEEWGWEWEGGGEGGGGEFEGGWGCWGGIVRMSASAKVRLFLGCLFVFCSAVALGRVVHHQNRKG